MGTELVGVSEEGSYNGRWFHYRSNVWTDAVFNVSVASACLLQRISTRMRAIGFGMMSNQSNRRLLNRWIERDLQEKRQRSYRQLAQPTKRRIND